MGVIKGGYGCRNCNHERGDCRSCGGFSGREVRGFERDGYIVKVKVEKRKSLCPICGEELVKLHYLGARRVVKERGSPSYVGSFSDDLVDCDGSLNWCEAPSGSYG
jgi:hypothetical protein